MNGLVWGVQWRMALADRRGLWLRVLLPLGLILVAFTGAFPVGSGCAACVTLFLGLGMLETALPLLRDERSGLAARVIRGGISPASYLLQRAGAAAVLVLAALLPALLVIAMAARASVVETLTAAGALVLTLWIASVLGALLGAVSRSVVEALMVGGVVLVLLLHMSGVFHTPSPEGLGAGLEGMSPFRVLHESFTEMAAGGSVGGALAAVVWAVLLPVAVGLLAPRLMGRVRAAG